MVDDAIFLDAASWKMLLRIATEVPHVLLVIATRPLNKLYMAAFAEEIPQEFKALRRLPKTIYAPLQPRGDGVLYKIACLSLGVADVPPMLADFLLARANGNPKVVKECCYELRAHYELFTVEDGQVWLRDGIDWLRLGSSMRCPFSVRALCARRLDRLSYKAQMIIKIASLLGNGRFSFRVIQDVYPLREKKSLQREFSMLRKFNIICPADPPLIGSVAENDIEWCFVDSFMQNMLRNRLISNQTKQLRVRVLNARIAHFVKILAQCKEQQTGIASLSTTGTSIRDGVHAVKHCSADLWNEETQSWELKYIVLTYRGLFVLDDKEDFYSAVTNKGQICWWIRMNTALAFRENEFRGRNFTLVLRDVQDFYSRFQKELFEKPKSFRFALASYDAMEKWLDAIKGHQPAEKLEAVQEEREPGPRSASKALRARSDVLSSFQAVLQPESLRTDECFVKKFRGVFITSMYKKRFIMLATSKEPEAEGDEILENNADIRAGFTSVKMTTPTTKGGRDEEEEEEAIQLLIVSKTDGIKEKANVTDAVCLSTRCCKVEYKLNWSDDDGKKKSSSKTTSKGGDGDGSGDQPGGGSLLISGQLWMKKSNALWEQKTMEIDFHDDDLMYFWFHKIHDAIHKYRRKPDITESKLASHFEETNGLYSSPTHRAADIISMPTARDARSVMMHEVNGWLTFDRSNDLKRTAVGGGGAGGEEKQIPTTSIPSLRQQALRQAGGTMRLSSQRFLPQQSSSPTLPGVTMEPAKGSGAGRGELSEDAAAAAAKVGKAKAKAMRPAPAVSSAIGEEYDGNSAVALGKTSNNSQSNGGGGEMSKKGGEERSPIVLSSPARSRINSAAAVPSGRSPSSSHKYMNSNLSVDAMSTITAASGGAGGGGSMMSSINETGSEASIMTDNDLQSNAGTTVTSGGVMTMMMGEGSSHGSGAGSANMQQLRQILSVEQDKLANSLEALEDALAVIRDATATKQEPR
eukprot:jgi/Bigna1/141870/aug1.65_g16578